MVVVLLLGIGLIVLGLAIVNQARQDEAAQAEAIVVLGTAQWNGRPSSTFQARLDHAFELYQQEHADLIVLTGGVAPGDVYAEAEVGADYLRQIGVADSDLISVPVGLDSYESLRAAADRLHELDRERVILVSDPFHMFRITRIAEDLGLDPLGSPTTTSPIRPGTAAEQRYVVREIFAYLNYVVFDS